MKFLNLPLVLSFCSVSAVFGAEFLVGVGKDETTGKKGIGFDPSVITPSAGDTIAWEFRSGQHSVVQSTFDNPCTPLEGGINTGVQTVADDLSVDAPGLPVIRITVNDTQPLWFFDQAGGLCNKGAVLAINPTTTQSAAAFKENASKAPASPPPSSSSSSTSSTEPAPSSTETSTKSNSAISMNLATHSVILAVSGVVLRLL